MRFAAVIFFFVASGSFAQKGLKWINYPLFNGMLDFYQSDSASVTDHYPYPENNKRDYLCLEGHVKEIKQVSYYSPSMERKVETHVKYTIDGRVESIRETIIDSVTSTLIRSFSIDFLYDSQRRIAHEVITDIRHGHMETYEGDTIYYERDTTFYNDTLAPFWFGHDLPEPLETHANGNYSVMAVGRDTTHAFYDEYGRKTMDSIARNNFTEGLKVRYIYEGDTVVREETWSVAYNTVEHRDIFLLDSRGNWIEKKEYGLWDVGRGRWSYLHRRKITYYDE